MQKSILKNGLEIYTKSIDSAKTCTFSIYAKVGSYHETDKFGIAHFVEHMVFKGTKNRNATEIMEAIENVGGYYRDWETDRKSTRLNSSHSAKSRMPSSA